MSQKCVTEHGLANAPVVGEFGYLAGINEMYCVHIRRKRRAIQH